MGRFISGVLGLVLFCGIYAIEALAVAPVASDSVKTTAVLSVNYPADLEWVDNDGGTFSVTVTTPPQLGSLSCDITGVSVPVTAGVPVECYSYGVTFLYTTTNPVPAADGFVWHVSDGSADSGSATCSIVITTNKEPVAAVRSYSTSVGSVRYPLSLIVSNRDSYQVHSYMLTTAPERGTLEYQSGSSYVPVTTGQWYSKSAWLYSSTGSAAGTDTFTWVVSDGISTSAPALFEVELTSNRLATISAMTSAVVIGTVREPLAMRCSDPDYYQEASFLLQSAPTNGTLEYLSGTNYYPVATNTALPWDARYYYWYYTPYTNSARRDSFRWCANDGITNSAAATYVLTLGSNGTPRALNSVTTCIIPGVTPAPARFTDPDVQDWTVRVISGPAHGSVATSGVGFAYTPAGGYEGPDSFSFVVNDGFVDSNTATNRLLVRAENSRGGMTVLLVVKDTLLPEITNEVERLQADLVSEGYTAKITSWAPFNAAQLWTNLVSEYNSTGQFVAGAILIGNLPTAMNSETWNTTDYGFMNMQSFQNTDVQHIWVSRLYTVGFSGGEVKRMKWALDANHGYRTGTHRLPHTAYWYDAAYGELNSGNVTNARIVWPVMEHLLPVDAFRKGGDFMNVEMHGDGAFVDSSGAQYDWHPSQVRVGVYSSCNAGRLSGPVNQNISTYGGGVVLSAGDSTIAPSGGLVLMYPWKIPYMYYLNAGDTWGNGLLREVNPFEDVWRCMFYGDLSLPAKAAPANNVPVVNSLSRDKSTGPAPLTVNFSVRATDSDGTISNYDWFANGYAAWSGPTSAGTATNYTSVYTSPHRYAAEVHAVDNYLARGWAATQISVTPASNQPFRVRCGMNFDTYEGGWDYVDPATNLWVHDQFFATNSWGYTFGQGDEGYVAQAVANTASDVLYQRFRTGPSFTYRIPVANGAYWLRLNLADMQSSAAGQRVMDVVAEGVTHRYGLDVFAQAGGKSATTVELYVPVADGELTFTVSANAASQDDAFLNCFEVIPYSGGNRPPQALNQSLSTPLNTPLGITLTATDPDGNHVVCSQITGPAHGTISGQAPNLTYTPDAGYLGTDSFKFLACDGASTGTVATVSLNVTGVIGEWNLNEATGLLAADSSEAGNDGTIGAEGVAWSAGRIGAGLSFDGVTGRVSVSSAPYSGTVNTFSMAMWVKPGGLRVATAQQNSGVTGTGGQRYAIFPTLGDSYGTGHAGAGVSVGTNGVSVFEHGGSYLPSLLVHSATITGWTHVAVVYDNRTPKLYLNGVLVRTGVTSTKTVHPGCAMGGSPYGWYKGELDEVSIRNYAMTAAEVADLAAAGVPGAGVAPVISGAATVTGLVEQTFCYMIAAGGTQPVDVNAEGLPAWLTFDGTNVLSGIPPASGTNSITLTAANSAGSTAKTVTVAVIQGPLFAQAAIASPSPVTGTAAALSALGSDSAGEENLTYTWATTGVPPGPVLFSGNGDNAAKSVTAVFACPGDYALQVAIRNPAGQTIRSDVMLTVVSSSTSVVVLPASASVATNATLQFTATASDQFGEVMQIQPAFVWSVSGGGTINPVTGLFTSGGAAGGPYPVIASYGARSWTAEVSVVQSDARKMTVAFPGYNRSGVLTNFPVLLKFSAGLTNGFSYSQVKSGQGYDLRFMNAAETQELNYEIEKWDTGGESFVWVQIPRLESNTVIVAGWGDAALAGVPAVYTTNGAVWDADFRGVWHLSETGAPVADWTRRSAGGVTVGSGVNYGVTGKVAGAVQMTQTPANGGIRIPDCNALDAGSSDFTVEVWMRKEATSTNWSNIGTFNKWYTGSARGSNEWSLGTCVGGNDDRPAFSVEIGTNQYSAQAPASISLNTWNHIAGLRRGTTLEVYVNGVLKGTTNGVSGPVNNAGRDLHMSYFTGNSNLSQKASMDETRVSMAARSADWLWAGFQNIASNNIFSSFGVVTNAGAPAVVDSNTNGMADSWEIANFGSTSAVNGGPGYDADGDGMSNLAEYRAGTSPTNAGSVLEFAGLAQAANSPTGLVLTWSSVSGRFYSIRSSTNLLLGFDGISASNIPATPAVNTHTVTVDQIRTRYYRVTVE